MKATLNDLLNAKGVSEPLREAAKALIDRLELAEKERESWKGLAQQFGNEADTLRSKITEMEQRLRLILEEPENTISNSKAMREMIKQARLALEAKP